MLVGQLWVRTVLVLHQPRFEPWRTDHFGYDLGKFRCEHIRIRNHSVHSTNLGFLQC